MPKHKFDDPKPCPNCESDQTYQADRCYFVACRQCHMTGPIGRSGEEAVELWNSLPRRSEVEVTNNPKCDRCGIEIIPGMFHYCPDDTEVSG